MEVALGCFNDDEEDVCDDPSQPPTTAMAYLRRVQQEAAECPDIVIADEYRNRSSIQEIGDQEILNDDVVSIIDAPPQNKQTQIASSYALLRQMYIRYKKTHRADTFLELPDVDYEVQWRTFCYGNLLASKKNDMPIVNGHEPLLSIISQINQPMAFRILNYHYLWINRYGFSVSFCKWIFSLMLCIDRPTPPDIVSLLRNIARKCFQIRTDITSGNTNELSDDVIFHLDLIIIIVSKYFRQMDLSF